MRITVSLDTQTVITQPSPARAKAGGFVPVEVAFTRGTQSVMLPVGSTIEFSLKPKNTWTGGMLVYHSAFSLGAGGIYVGIANFASEQLLEALGLTDNAPANDIGQIEAASEIVWDIGGQRFRSATFAVTVESPLTDAIIIPPTDPTLYPTPAELQSILDAKAATVHGHAIDDIEGLQTALNTKANTSSLGNYVQRTPAASNFRFQDGTILQLFNPDTGLWHTLSVRGNAGHETLEISASIP